MMPREDQSQVVLHDAHVQAYYAHLRQRSPVNWFLDAATYAHDGDTAQAIAAAQRGIAALTAEGSDDA